MLPTRHRASKSAGGVWTTFGVVTLSEGTAAEEEDAELAVAEEQRAPSAGAASASALVLRTTPQPPQQPRTDAPTELLSISNNTASDCACTICPPENRLVFSSRLRLQNHLNKLHEHASAAELAPMAMAPCCALGCGAFFSVLPNKPDQANPIISATLYMHMQKKRGWTSVNANGLTDAARGEKAASVQAHTHQLHWHGHGWSRPRSSRPLRHSCPD